MSWDPQAATPASAQKEESTEPEQEQQQQNHQHMQPTAIQGVLAEQVWPVGTMNFIPRRCYGTWVMVQPPWADICITSIKCIAVKAACSEINARWYMIAEESVEQMVFNNCSPKMGILVGRLTWKISVSILENTLCIIYCLRIAGLIMINPEAYSHNAPCTANKVIKLIWIMLQLLQNVLPVLWGGSNKLRELSIPSNHICQGCCIQKEHIPLE